MTDDKELIARLRASRAVWLDGRSIPTEDETEAADRIEALSGLNKKLILKVSHYSDLLYDQLGTPCEQIRHKQEIEALEAKLAKAEEALICGRYFLNGEASRAQFDRVSLAALATIKGESHA